MKSEGVFALWKGIQAAWLREASYTTVKLGGYGPIRDAIGAKDQNAPFLLKVSRATSLPRNYHTTPRHSYRTHPSCSSSPRARRLARSAP